LYANTWSVTRIPSPPGQGFEIKEKEKKKKRKRCLLVSW